MTAGQRGGGPTFGFLHFAELGSGGWIGGYLILNTLGRPVEFHCSEPVRPNRAQQILYGATLRAYLFADQIGQALLSNSQLTPDILWVDRWDGLAIRTVTAIPTIGVLASENELPEGVESWTAGKNQLFAWKPLQGAQQSVEPWCEMLESWDLAEPFERIQEAMAELQRAA